MAVFKRKLEASLTGGDAAGNGHVANGAGAYDGLTLANGARMTGDVARVAKVYSAGPLLDAVQQAHIFPDSKTFVDMPMREDPEVVLKAFEDLPADAKKDPRELRAFVEKWFLEAGSDLEPWTPPDVVQQPRRLMEIADPDMRAWALELNKLWAVLGRRQSPSVKENPQRHSCLPREYPMVVPGGRFREMYYWDTYWIVRGLLVCDMVQTATGLVLNSLDQVQHFGFCPNGNRVYYLDRSQPPLLSAMVKAIHDATGDRGFLERALPILEKEYDFWMDPACGRLVQLPERPPGIGVGTPAGLPMAAVRSGGEQQTLNIYRSVRTLPRPEAYWEDVKTCREAPRFHRSAEELYEAICSGAESGWDFSTRWLEAGAGRGGSSAKLVTADTCNVIPVDLNSLLYGMERTLAEFHRSLASPASAERFEAAASLRSQTMEAWLWTGNSYRDYRLDVNAPSAVVSIADWAAPLWVGLHGPGGQAAGVMLASLEESGLLRLGGCATTAIDTAGRTQWDAPNVWPPLVHMLVEGLQGVPGAEALADCLSHAWIRSNYIAWKKTGFMHEKYDALRPGQCGAGGEYDPQVGFGWSNGVALELLVRPTREVTATAAL